MNNSFSNTKEAIVVAESCTAILSAYLEDALCNGITNLNQLRETNYTELWNFRRLVSSELPRVIDEILETVATQNFEEASRRTTEVVLMTRLVHSENLQSEIRSAKHMLDNLEKFPSLPTPSDAATAEQHLEYSIAWSTWSHNARKPLFDAYKKLSSSLRLLKSLRNCVAKIIDETGPNTLRSWRGYDETEKLARTKAMFEGRISDHPTRVYMLREVWKLIDLAGVEALVQALEHFEEELHRGMKMLPAVA